MRPIACESEDIMLIAPISCKISSAAIVSALILDSAKDTSSGMFLSRWWQTICTYSDQIENQTSIMHTVSILPLSSHTSMSRCSSIVLEVKGRVGFVDDGRTFFTPHTLMISGAWPPPAPSLSTRYQRSRTNINN